MTDESVSERNDLDALIALAEKRPSPMTDLMAFTEWCVEWEAATDAANLLPLLRRAKALEQERDEYWVSGACAQEAHTSCTTVVSDRYGGHHSCGCDCHARFALSTTEEQTVQGTVEAVQPNLKLCHYCKGMGFQWVFVSDQILKQVECKTCDGQGTVEVVE